MLMNWPTFLGTKEQSPSEMLYNRIKILIQTHIEEIFVNLDYGTNIRNYIKQGISNIVMSDIKDELTTKIMKYFSNDVNITNIEMKQDFNKIIINLDYVELRTGNHNTIQAQEMLITNNLL